MLVKGIVLAPHQT